ncbi:MAG: galactose mutarotase [Ruminococcaceae bacterium]|nr:galactose mutarotase [Oscillospiraceae bacterium]
MSYSVKEFGKLSSGETIFAYTLSNSSGVSATILNFGGILQSLYVPDKNGKAEDIVCGFDTVEDYLADRQYFGALIGRYANRIKNASFTIDGKVYQLTKNEGNNQLHGGITSYDRRIWNVNVIENGEEVTAELSIFSPDGDEGFPGNLELCVKYVLCPNGDLKLIYDANSDKDTVVNFTNHSYFNIGGYASGDINRFSIRIDADRYNEVDEELIPTALCSVEGTRYDLRKEQPFIETYDHNFALAGYDGTLRFAAETKDPESGRSLEVWTTLPGVQIYSAVNMCGDVKFKGGVEQKRHCACCFETQFFPDSPNHPEYPSCLLRAGEKHHSETEFRFNIK